MRLNLLKLIECSSCKCDFDLKVFEAVSKGGDEDEIKSGVLVCPKCRKYYFIIDYIPRLLPKEMFRNREFENRKARPLLHKPKGFSQALSVCHGPDGNEPHHKAPGIRCYCICSRKHRRDPPR